MNSIFGRPADFLTALVVGFSVAFLIGYQYLPINLPLVPQPLAIAIFAVSAILLVSLSAWRFGILTRNLGNTAALGSGAMLGVGYLLAADGFGVLQCVMRKTRFFCVGSEFGLLVNQIEFGVGLLLITSGVTIALALLAGQRRQLQRRPSGLIDVLTLVAFGSLVGNLAADPVRTLIGLPDWSYAHPDGVAWSGTLLVVLVVLDGLVKLWLWDFESVKSRPETGV